MRLLKGVLLCYLDFNSVYCLLSLRNTKILVEYFNILDVHNTNTLNDVQFAHFMREVTTFGEKEIMMTFDMLDRNGSGAIGFQQFYMLVCILLSSQHHVEKNFIFRHSRPVFELLDMDGGRTISPAEFQSSAFLFNLNGRALTKIFYDFDVSGDELLNYKEFKMFTMACIYMQEEKMKERASKRKSSAV
ncbi:EF-hand calcium-binding domain-containing protein 9-like [Alosa sapidissima]|uniref:EF-hand calcium-binding domain-containing protein 9-like n=1 Tax=Alosa sapidissima TaxID=34773 RepID=UPI001C0A381C|nr:EF-hand calcium-binding domain-containing protein 9-like [Alosa sapidissima]